MWRRDCTEIQEGFVRWRNCDVFKKTSLSKERKNTNTARFIRQKKQQTIDLEAVPLIKSKVFGRIP